MKYTVCIDKENALQSNMPIWMDWRVMMNKRKHWLINIRKPKSGKRILIRAWAKEYYRKSYKY